jgi:chromosome segregation ATPase
MSSCFVGPLDASFSAIVGPNGLGKTVLADAVRFTLGSMSSVRVKSAKEAINHQLVQRLGSKAACCTEVGFAIQLRSKHNSTAAPTSCADTHIRYLRVRRRVIASGQSVYYAICCSNAPRSDSWQDQLSSMPYVRIHSCCARTIRFLDT